MPLCLCVLFAFPYSQGLLLPKLAVNARGDVAVVNSALREGSHSRVWLMRGRL